MSTPAANPRDRVEEPTLRRRLGPLDGAAIVVSNVIGSGIFFVPMLVALAVSSGWAMLYQSTSHQPERVLKNGPNQRS